MFDGLEIVGFVDFIAVSEFMNVIQKKRYVKIKQDYIMNQFNQRSNYTHTLQKINGNKMLPASPLDTVSFADY